MKRALAAVVRSWLFAVTRVRVWIALLLMHLVIALPATLAFGRAMRESTNHRADADLIGPGLEFTFWSEMRDALANADSALLASAFISFLFGIFSSGGWLELLARRDQSPGLSRFAAGAGGRFFRFLRVALVSLALIAAARWLFYGAPANGLLRLLCGSDQTSELRTESAANLFTRLRSAGFALSMITIILVSDLARATLVVRGGRSAVVGFIEGAWLILRRPAACFAAAGAAFALELILLYGVSFWVNFASSGRPQWTNLISLFLAVQAAALVREWGCAARLGGLLQIVDRESDEIMARRYGYQQDVPFVAAAGVATADGDLD